MASTSDFRNGMCIEYNHGLYFIIEFLHVKPGKGAAFVRTKLKNVQTGRVIENTFNSGVKVNEVRIERRPYQFLYRDDLGCNLMNQETFEQISIDENLINGVKFMKEGEILEVVTQVETDTILYADMPANVVLQITYTEPGVKGDTATNTLKPATVETGAEVRVPLFLNINDYIRIDTRDGSYIERAKV